MTLQHRISKPLAQDFASYMQHHPELYQEFANFILKQIPSTQNLCIVDIGSGPGLLLKELIQLLPKSRIIGIEPNEAMNIQAKQILHTFASERYDLLKENAVTISLPAKSVDVVVSRFSAYAWDKPEKVLEEILRILKPGGVLVFELLNKGFPSWQRKITKWGMKRKHASSKVIQFHINAYKTAYSPEVFQALLDKKGFTNISIIGKKHEWKFRVLAYAPV